MRVMLAAFALIALASCTPQGGARGGYNVEEKTIAQLQADMTAGQVTSEQITQAYLDRIERIDRAGPNLNSVLALNPDAIAQARALDQERAQGHVRGPLHGIPILIKDNIETQDNVATTAGSLALADNITHRDAPLVARLRAAGAVILGKTNLSEWANIRDTHSTSGWSAVGGLTRNPYALDRNACGSSSGSGAAAAASLAAAAIGTETDGSITCPSAINGLVGIKPTVGLVSRTYVVPISHSQDTPGPMGRTVADVAAVLNVIAGSDPADAATHDADAHRVDYLAALNADSLRGKRIGVLRFEAGFLPDVDTKFTEALHQLEAAGATLVEIQHEPPGVTPEAVGNAELTVLLTELRADLNTYLASTPQTVHARTLHDVIAFNAATPAEMLLFRQDQFDKAEATHGLTDRAYLAARATWLRLAGAQGIDRMMREQHLDALVAPTLGPTWTTDIVNGDHFTGGALTTTLPAVAGYPHVTVPMGLVHNLPVGLSIMGEKWSEAKLLSFAFAYESRAHARAVPTYAHSITDAEPYNGYIRHAAPPAPAHSPHAAPFPWNGAARNVVECTPATLVCTHARPKTHHQILLRQRRRFRVRVFRSHVGNRVHDHGRLRRWRPVSSCQSASL